MALLLGAPWWVDAPATLAAQPQAAQPQATATPVATVYSGGEILTMAGDQPAYAEALVEKGGRILQVGPLAEALRLAGPGARRVDLAGRTLLPGFIDAHGHLPDYITTWGRPDLSPPPVGTVKNVADIQAVVRRWLAEHPAPAGQLVFFSGYDDSLLAERRHPTRADLDAVSATVPILLMHASGHLVVANSAALALVKIDRATPDPAGGHIQRDPATGEPNGVLEEAAGFPFMALIPQPTLAEKLDKLDEVQRWWASFGLTTAQDGLSNPANLELFREAGRQGRLLLDVVAYPFFKGLGDPSQLEPKLKEVEIVKPAAAWPLGSMTANAGQEFAGAPQGTLAGRPTVAPRGTLSSQSASGTSAKLRVGIYDHHLKIGGIKLVSDGSPQGRTAYLSEPYTTPPPGQPTTYRAYPVMTQQEVNDWVALAWRNNLQVITHTNGDAAVEQLLTAVAQARARYGAKDLRPVAIHSQLARHDQVDRMAQLGIMPSFFSAHTFFWGDWHRKMLGEARAAGISPLAYAHSKGLRFTNHNDAPVVPPDMLLLTQTAVTRTTRSGVVLGPSERVSPYVALKAITDWAAYQYFEEASKGTLVPGKRADLVILERNPLKVAPGAIGTIRVVETIKDGRSIYRLGRDRIDARKAAAASRVAADPLQAHSHLHDLP
jgi:predicted amidohydrolase YtcJ